MTAIELRNVNRHFDKVLLEANLPWVTIYDLRHLTASELIGARVDVRRVAAILGHANPADQP